MVLSKTGIPSFVQPGPPKMVAKIQRVTDNSLNQFEGFSCIKHNHKHFLYSRLTLASVPSNMALACCAVTQRIGPLGGGNQIVYSSTFCVVTLVMKKSVATV